MSAADIAAGAFWDKEIREKVAEAAFAIVCVTPENYAAPWLNYEAGALAERMGGNTCPYILGAGPEVLGVSPLSRLQARRANKIETLQLLHSINEARAQKLEADVVDRAFEHNWPDLEVLLSRIPQQVVPPRSLDERVDETLAIVQSLARGALARSGFGGVAGGGMAEHMMGALVAEGAPIESFGIVQVYSIEGGGWSFIVTSQYTGASFAMAVDDSATHDTLRRVARKAVEHLRLNVPS